MTTMIERVARAICASENGNNPDAESDGLPDGPTVPLWTNYVHSARAALEAMKEPTEAMGRIVRERCGGVSHDYEYRAWVDAALIEHEWNAKMAALEEGE